MAVFRKIWSNFLENLFRFLENLDKFSGNCFPEKSFFPENWPPPCLSLPLRPWSLPSMGINTNGIYYQGASIPTIFTITGHQYQWYLPSMGIYTKGIHTNGHPYQWYPYQSALSTALSAALAMTNVSPLEWGGSLPPPRHGWGLIISKSLTN